MRSAVPSGWYPDPRRRHRLRYWDGQQWTAWTADGDQPILDAASPRPRRALLAVSGIGAIVAMPFAAWWLIGDQSTKTSRPRDQLEQLWQAPAISGRVTAIVGAIALAIAAVGVVACVVAVRRRMIDDPWLLVLFAFLAAGGLVGFIGRAFTAATIGANIGAGVVMITVVPTVFVLTGYGFLQAAWLIIRRHRPPAAP